MRLSDIATVSDSVEDIRTGGLSNGSPPSSSSCFASREPTSSRPSTAFGPCLPQLQASIPPTIKLSVVIDATRTIRASVRDVEITMMISIALVILVVFVFLRDVRSTFIPSVAVPVSLIGTFGVMYLLHYSIDNLSLMALTIATGFVVDDAIVVIENITRHLEEGMKPLEAALQGAQEIGFTVMSISLSLVAVFIPILLMGGIVGRLFREFAVTLSVAIGVSLVISLTATPMMCAKLLPPHDQVPPWTSVPVERTWVRRDPEGVREVARLGLAAPAVHDRRDAGDHGRDDLLCTRRFPRDFFLSRTRAGSTGTIQADQDTSFQAMQKKLGRVRRRPSCRIPTSRAPTGSSGGGTVNSRPDVHLLEALREAQDYGRPDHRASARQARARSRRHARPSAGPGRARGRPTLRGAVPVHAAGGRLR